MKRCLVRLLVSDALYFYYIGMDPFNVEMWNIVSETYKYVFYLIAITYLEIHPEVVLSLTHFYTMQPNEIYRIELHDFGVGAGCNRGFCFPTIPSVHLTKIKLQARRSLLGSK
jgi:hypothetical protein